MGRLEKPTERLKSKQKAAGHLIGSQCSRHVLVHCQNVAQAPIERSLPINGRPTGCFVDELHDIHADPKDMGMGGGEACELRLRWLSAVDQGRPQITHDVENISPRGGQKRVGAPNGVLNDDFMVWSDPPYAYADYVFRGAAKAAKLVDPPIGYEDL